MLGMKQNTHVRLDKGLWVVRFSKAVVWLRQPYKAANYIMIVNVVNVQVWLHYRLIKKQRRNQERCGNNVMTEPHIFLGTLTS